MTQLSGPFELALECQDLGKSYTSRGETVPALADVSLQVRPREFVCIVGPSGCGKSTLLKLIAGLIEPSTGRVVIHRNNLGGRPANAMVFQEHGLFPWMTVLDNVAFGLEMRGIAKKERLDRAMGFIQMFGLAQFASSYPHELSVGMRQRAGVARAFLVDPDLLLMDEPFGALDAQSKLLLEEELLRVWRDHQKTVLYVTHDIEEALLLGDRVVVMSGRPGRVREEIIVPIERPRDRLDARPEAREIKWHIWETLRVEAQRNLSLPPSDRVDAT